MPATNIAILKLIANIMQIISGLLGFFVNPVIRDGGLLIQTDPASQRLRVGP
jgi:hypothetical protein